MFGTRSAPRPVPTHVPSPDQPRELVLYKYDTCPYCRRVQARIDALRLGDRVAFRDVRTDPGARDELFEATGRTTVPCLFVDGQPLFESADINAWLEAYARRDEPSWGA